jgi:hypothetical protein
MSSLLRYTTTVEEHEPTQELGKLLAENPSKGFCEMLHSHALQIDPELDTGIDSVVLLWMMLFTWQQILFLKKAPTSRANLCPLNMFRQLDRTS